jgi:hypothetical protein
MDLMTWFGPFAIAVAAIVGAFTYAIVAMRHKARMHELEIRERIALIEKGLLPSPETDPHGFERAMNRMEQVQWSGAASRHRRAGILLMGVGLGLTVLIGFSGSPEEGLAVGGSVAIIGLAFLVNSFFEGRQEPPTRSARPAPPSGPDAVSS